MVIGIKKGKETDMKLFIIAALGILLSGCVSVGEFLGSTDPCGQAANIHAAYLVGAATNKELAQFRRQERTGYAAVVEYCNGGDVKKVTLQRLVAAYAAAVADWKSGG